MAMSANSRVIFGSGSSAVQTIPQEMTVSINAVDYDSGRVADGTMERNMLGEKRKVELTFPPMHSAELRRIINAVSGTDNAKLTATFPDPWSSTGTYSGDFYVGDRSAPVYNFSMDLWNNISFNIVEY